MRMILLLVAFTRLLFALSLASLLTFGAMAQSPATGGIEGRVFDAGRGEYLENARVTIEGTALETFTDSGGTYRIGNVPVGTARVRVFFTGIPSRTETVAVGANKTTAHDITLRAGASGATVKLDEFVVSTSKEMDAAAIAINEQRVAPRCARFPWP